MLHLNLGPSSYTYVLLFDPSMSALPIIAKQKIFTKCTCGTYLSGGFINTLNTSTMI